MVHWVGNKSAGRGIVYREGGKKRELRQRHVGDVAWLLRAEERGGVVEHWRSAERVRLREPGDKAGGEEARSKDRTVLIKRGRAEEHLSCTATKQQSREPSVRK